MVPTSSAKLPRTSRSYRSRGSSRGSNSRSKQQPLERHPAHAAPKETAAATQVATARDNAAAEGAANSSDDEPELVGVSLPTAALLGLHTPQPLKAYAAAARLQQQQQQQQQPAARAPGAASVSLGLSGACLALEQPGAAAAAETETATAARGQKPPIVGPSLEDPKRKRQRTSEPQGPPRGPLANEGEMEEEALRRTGAVTGPAAPAAPGAATAAARASAAAAEAKESLMEIVVSGLRELAEVYEQQGEAWRASGFRRAATVVAAACDPTRPPPQALPRGPTSPAAAAAGAAAAAELKGGLTKSNVHLLRGLPGVGASIMRTIEEIVARGSSSRMKALQQDTAAAAALQQLQLIFGVGPKTARMWHAKGFTLASLRQTQQQLQQLQQQLQRIRASNSSSSTKHLRAAAVAAAAKEEARIAAAVAAAAEAFPLTREQTIGLCYAEAFAVKAPRKEVAAVVAYLQRLLLHSPCNSNSSNSSSSSRSDSSSRGASSNGDVGICLCCSCCGASCSSYLNTNSSSGCGPESCREILEVIGCGSFRRGCAECGDIDFVLIRTEDGTDAKLIFRSGFRV